MGRTTINVSDEVLKKILLIKESRPQDQSRNDTISHILYIYEEQKSKQEKGIIPFKPVKLSEIIDADKANKDFVQIGRV